MASQPKSPVYYWIKNGISFYRWRCRALSVQRQRNWAHIEAVQRNPEKIAKGAEKAVA
ncbi:hypothetical protein N8135_03720 [Oceanospirillaceae bacterium]|nr:hypothetical protein [Oceanospirillaceae bacterium]